MLNSICRILVFVLSDRDSSHHRKPVHVFKQSSIVLRMLYLDDRVFCGNRNGNVIVYSRNDGKRNLIFFPKDKILDSFKFKAFAEYKINVTEKLNLFWEGWQTMREQKKILVTSISSFSHNVFKRLFINPPPPHHCLEYVGISSSVHPSACPSIHL